MIHCYIGCTESVASRVYAGGTVVQAEQKLESFVLASQPQVLCSFLVNSPTLFEFN